jgi:hypothetical protein
MFVKIHFRLTQNRAGLPIDFSAARRFPANLAERLEEHARQAIAADYEIPASAVEINRVED